MWLSVAPFCALKEARKLSEIHLEANISPLSILYQNLIQKQSTPMSAIPPQRGLISMKKLKMKSVNMKMNTLC